MEEGGRGGRAEQRKVNLRETLFHCTHIQDQKEKTRDREEGEEDDERFVSASRRSTVSRVAATKRKRRRKTIRVAVIKASLSSSLMGRQPPHHPTRPHPPQQVRPVGGTGAMKAQGPVQYYSFEAVL